MGNGREEEWKKIKRLANRSRLTERLVKQVKLRFFRISPQYKYGFEVPKNFKHSEKLDKKNGIQSGWIQTNWNTSNLMNMTSSLTKENLQAIEYQRASD